MSLAGGEGGEGEEGGGDAEITRREEEEVTDCIHIIGARPTGGDRRDQEKCFINRHAHTTPISNRTTSGVMSNSRATHMWVISSTGGRGLLRYICPALRPVHY